MLRNLIRNASIAATTFIPMAALLTAQPANANIFNDLFGDPTFYAVIVYAPSTKTIAWATNENREVGEYRALESCRKYASDCRVATWVKNGVAVLASSPNGAWSTSWGSISRASSVPIAAENGCFRNGGTNCQVKMLVVARPGARGGSKMKPDGSYGIPF
jgi:Domain of unknown function (DUF4189)